MLPAYIIQVILEEERRRRAEEADRLVDSPDIEPPRPREEGEATTERGVAIVDFTI